MHDQNADQNSDQNACKEQTSAFIASYMHVYESVTN